MLIQHFNDKFGIRDKKRGNPAAPGSVLGIVKEGEESLSAKLQTYLQSGSGEAIHIMQGSRPEISHAVRDLAKMTGAGNNKAIKEMHRLMEHYVGTPTRGVTLRPEGSWDGTKNHTFIISGRSDSDYAKYPDTRKLMSGTRVSVNGAPTQWISVTQKHVTLSVAEAE